MKRHPFSEAAVFVFLVLAGFVVAALLMELVGWWDA